MLACSRVIVLSALVLLLSCQGAPKSSPETSQLAPARTPTAEPPEPRPQRTSVVLPERDPRRPLELAEGRVLGLPVPTSYDVRDRRADSAFGFVPTEGDRLRRFYRDLGYHVLDQKVGFKVLPSREVLARMPEAEAELARHAIIYCLPRGPRRWSLQIFRQAASGARK